MKKIPGAGQKRTGSATLILPKTTKLILLDSLLQEIALGADTVEKWETTECRTSP